MTNPTFTLITSPGAPWHGLILKARELATEHGGNFRAPHHTASRPAIFAEMAIAAGGTLLLDEPAEFSRAAINAVAHTWAAMDPACRPRLVLILRGPGVGASTLARCAELFEGWTIAEHYTADEGSPA